MHAYLALEPYFEVIAVADFHLERAQKITAGLPTKAVNQAEDLLKDPAINIVDICLPPDQHFLWVQKALQHKKYAICEKPLFNSIQEYDQIQELSRLVERQVFPVFQYRFGLGFQKLLA